ncbi:diacylglycerol/lipid kinase family protein [Rhodohalobacter sp. 8-1]|uniref:diacylglycerol/lipid kinase family protein n=1 Tax=Rhodohalobacter sp. 8-1 TaxID=3131972 RepID=UPI0030EB779D
MAITDICFLFNTQSNSGKALGREQELRQQVNLRWPDADIINTGADEYFWSDLQHRLRGYKTLVACGGDGTVHRTGNLAARLGAVLGIVPMGSGNDFAHMMGIPKILPDALDHLLKNDPRPIDLIKVDGDLDCFCLNTAGIGLDGLANHHTELYKRTLGRAAYAAGALKAVKEITGTRMSVTTDGTKRTGKFLMVTACNGKREGGSFWVAPNAEPDDGLIDLLIVKPMRLPLLLMALPMFLISGPERMFNINRTRCKKIEVICREPVYMHVDGEYSSTHVKQLVFQVKPSALKVIA